MFKFVAIALVAIGIFIGVKYSDEIEDVFNEDTVEHIQDGVEQIQDSVSQLTEKVEDLKN